MEHRQRGALRFLWIIPVIAILLIAFAKINKTENETQKAYQKMSCNKETVDIVVPPHGESRVFVNPKGCGSSLWFETEEDRSLITLKALTGKKWSIHPMLDTQTLYGRQIEKFAFVSRAAKTIRVRITFHSPEEILRRTTKR